MHTPICEVNIVHVGVIKTYVLQYFNSLRPVGIVAKVLDTKGWWSILIINQRATLSVIYFTRVASRNCHIQASSFYTRP